MYFSFSLIDHFQHVRGSSQQAQPYRRISWIEAGVNLVAKEKLFRSDRNVQKLNQRALKEPNRIYPIVHVGNNWNRGLRGCKDWVSFPITDTSCDSDLKLIVTCLLCACFSTRFPQTFPFPLSYLGVGGGFAVPPFSSSAVLFRIVHPFNPPSAPLYYREVC